MTDQESILTAHIYLSPDNRDPLSTEPGVVLSITGYAPQTKKKIPRRFHMIWKPKKRCFLLFCFVFHVSFFSYQLWAKMKNLKVGLNSSYKLFLHNCLFLAKMYSNFQLYPYNYCFTNIHKHTQLQLAREEGAVDVWICCEELYLDCVSCIIEVTFIELLVLDQLIYLNF